MSTLEELRTNKPKTIEDVDAWLAAYTVAIEEARAKARSLERLHEAAPELLKALRGCLALLECHETDAVNGPPQCMVDARAAIAAATAEA